MEIRRLDFICSDPQCKQPAMFEVTRRRQHETDTLLALNVHETWCEEHVPEDVRMYWDWILT